MHVQIYDNNIVQTYYILLSHSQLRREFREVIGIEGRITSLMDSWPDWEQKLIALSKVESATRPAIKSTLQQLDESEVEDDIAYASGKSTAAILVPYLLQLSEQLYRNS